MGQGEDQWPYHGEDHRRVHGQPGGSTVGDPADDRVGNQRADGADGDQQGRLAHGGSQRVGGEKKFDGHDQADAEGTHQVDYQHGPEVVRKTHELAHPAHRHLHRSWISLSTPYHHRGGTRSVGSHCLYGKTSPRPGAKASGRGLEPIPEEPSLYRFVRRIGVRYGSRARTPGGWGPGGPGPAHRA